MAEQVKRRDLLRDARGMVRGELDDAVTEADVLRSLARRTEEDFWRERVRVLLEEVVLDLPGVLIAERVGELDLLDRLVQLSVFAVCIPGAGQLMLVEDAESHWTQACRRAP
jgi:hypothetical protein